MKNEDELVEDILRGDCGSFEILLRPYRQGLLSMAYRMSGDWEEAKEICQEAVIKVFKHLHKFKKGKSFKSWLYSIAVNSAHDFLRRKKKYQGLIESQKSLMLDTGPDPEKLLMDKEVKAKIEFCLQRLSPKEKAVFLLRDGEGFSVKEASEVLGCSSMSVRTHLSRARQKIRERFEKIYPAAESEVKA
jgi:RNA polymerase sigma-70 factor (ECF subfamily)